MLLYSFWILITKSNFLQYFDIFASSAADLKVFPIGSPQDLLSEILNQYLVLRINLIIMAKQFNNPLIEALIVKLRDPQTDRKAFRHALEKVGEYLAIEVSK